MNGKQSNKDNSHIITKLQPITKINRNQQKKHIRQKRVYQEIENEKLITIIKRNKEARSKSFLGAANFI
tara:strand:+ start:29 stop:235 length:207 start_codon:yes stop_codon:yes gene_type:complete